MAHLVKRKRLKTTTALINQVIDTVKLSSSEVTAAAKLLQEMISFDQHIITIKSVKENGNDDQLLLGYINSDCLGNLTLEDNSGILTCKFLSTPFQGCGCLVLITKWFYCFHELQSYIEVFDYNVLLPISDDFIPSTRVIKLSEIKSYPKPHTELTVRAMVSAISPIMRRGYKELICLVTLEEGDLRYVLVIKDLCLLYLSELLHLHKSYIFTMLCDSVMNKGDHLEARVLTTTSLTKVYPSFDEFYQIATNNIQEDIISYQGAITNVICPEAGLYELDHSIWFLLYDGMDEKGLRSGAVVQLHSCHLVNTHFWKGFLCCPCSKVSVIQFSSNDTPYQPLYSRRNKLVNFLFKNHPSVIVWLVYAYLRLRHKLYDIASFSVILGVLNYLAGLVFTNNVYMDPVNSFFSYPHNCGYYNLNFDFMLPSLCNVPLPTCPAHSGNDTDVVKRTYSITEYENVALVGHVIGDNNTGYPSLIDATGHLHFLLPNFIEVNNCVLVVNNYKMVIERITISHSVLCCHDYTFHYVIPTNWALYPLSHDIPNTTTSAVLYFYICDKTHSLKRSNSLQQFQVEILASNDEAQLSQYANNHSGSVTQHVLEFKGRQWYQFLQYGNLYRLTTATIIATFYNIIKDDKIELVKENWLPVIELSLVSIYGNILSWKDKFITFSGTVESVSFRINHFCPCKESTSEDISENLYVQDVNKKLTLVVELKNGLHSIMVYIKMEDIPYPLGLLPNTNIRCENFLLKLSKTGRPYALHCHKSSIKLLNDKVSFSSAIYQATHLSVLLEQILYGSRFISNVYVIQAHISKVQQVSFQWKCDQCQSLVGDNHKETCFVPTPIFTATSRVLIEDGSCEAHLYAESDMVRELLCISSDQWTHLKEMTSKVGQLSYVRYPFQEEKLKTCPNDLRNIIQQNSIYRQLKATVNPFISKAEASSHQNCRNVNIYTGNQKYTTLVHPRLQLNLVSILSSSFRAECNAVFELLTKEHL